MAESLEEKLRQSIINSIKKLIVVLKTKKDAVAEGKIFNDRDDFAPEYLSQLVEYYERKIEYFKNATSKEIEEYCLINHNKLLKELIDEKVVGENAKKVDKMIMTQSDKTEIYEIYLSEQPKIADRSLTSEIFSIYDEAIIPIPVIYGISNLDDESLSKATKMAIDGKWHRSFIYSEFAKAQTVNFLTRQIKKQTPSESGEE